MKRISFVVTVILTLGLLSGCVTHKSVEEKYPGQLGASSSIAADSSTFYNLDLEELETAYESDPTQFSADYNGKYVFLTGYIKEVPNQEYVLYDDYSNSSIKLNGSIFINFEEGEHTVQGYIFVDDDDYYMSVDQIKE